MQFATSANTNPVSPGKFKKTVSQESPQSVREFTKQIEVRDQTECKETFKAIKNALKYPNMCHFIRYNDMVANPEKVFKKLYKFLDEPYYPHQFQNLKQININDIEYNDTVLGKNMHTIKSTVKKQINNYIVPERIKQKYGHIKV